MEVEATSNDLEIEQKQEQPSNASDTCNGAMDLDVVKSGEEENAVNHDLDLNKSVATASNGDLEGDDSKESMGNSVMFYRATTSTESEEELAMQMGYPNGWRVVRVVPHPADEMLYRMMMCKEKSDSSKRDHFLATLSSHSDDDIELDKEFSNPFSGNNSRLADFLASSYMDQIYTGKPDSGCDMYFNHEAAMQAALKWVEGTSTCYDDKGGQLLPREPKFKVDDTIEVYYEDEDTWYYATVVKVKEYLNDIRYNVFFPEEEATQENVNEENMRSAPKKNPKKKGKSSKASKGSSLMELPTPGKKRKGPTSRLSAKEIKERSKLAKGLGFPEGWLAMYGSKSTLRIWNPDGEMFQSKKRALESLEMSDVEQNEEDIRSDGRPSRRAKKQKKDNRRHSRRSSKHDKPSYKLDESDPEDDPNDLIPYSPPGQALADNIEEGDPPWRREGHEYLGRLVNHSFRSAKGRRITQQGIVTGWLDAKDVDSSGNPAYIGEKSNEPEMLFRVDFDETSELLFVDMEEYEVVSNLVFEEDSKLSKAIDEE